MTGIPIRRAVCRLEGAFGLTVAFELLKAPAACFGIALVVFDHYGDAQPRGFGAHAIGFLRIEKVGYDDRTIGELLITP